jgi:FkbM family methyltransferase
VLTRLPNVTDSPSFWQRLSAQSGHLAFDIGANIGQAAALLASRFATVVSFEPCAEAVTILMTETAPNVVVLPVAVSDRNGTVELDETANSIQSGQLTTGTRLGWGEIIGHRTVESVTVDQAAAKWGWPQLVKVDTEGHEVRVLQGAASVLRRHRTVWLIEVHGREHEGPLTDLLDGYRVDRIDHDYLHGNPDSADHFYLEAIPDAA